MLGSPCVIDVLPAKDYERLSSSPRHTFASTKRAPASAPPSAAGGKHARVASDANPLADSFEAWIATEPHANGAQRTAGAAASAGGARPAPAGALRAMQDGPTKTKSSGKVGGKAAAPTAAAGRSQSMETTIAQWGTAEVRRASHAPSCACNGAVAGLGVAAYRLYSP